MKKILSAIICVALIFSVLTLVSCNKEETLKFGMGVYSVADTAKNADGDTKGTHEAEITAAAVLVDSEGKIVKCVIDTAQNKVSHTSEGKAVATESFKTKYELGNDYNMKLYGGSAKEWFEQVDAFCALVVGKTATEVKALIAEGDKGTDEVLNAGCTIMIADFVYALDAAIANAVDSEATADATLKLGMFTEQEASDATAEKEGKNEIETTVFAAAIGADNKIIAASSDCVQIGFTFNTAGESTYDLTAKIVSKKDKGTNYGMSSWGTDLNGDGTVKEWNEQAAAFDAACIGKTAGEIKSLMGENNYGTEELQNAGCTILVNGLVAAASKVG